MLLRDHPKLQYRWPPSWAVSFSGADKLPVAEDPDRLLSVEESELRETIILKAEYEGREVTRVILIEDSEFRSKLIEILWQNIGKSIREIGALNIQF